VLKVAKPQQLLRPHHVQHQHPRTVVSLEHAARWFDNLAVTGIFEFWWMAPTLRVDHQLLDVPEHALHQSGRGLRILDRDVLGNCVNIAQRLRCQRHPGSATLVPNSRVIVCIRAMKVHKIRVEADSVKVERDPFAPDVTAF